MLRNGRVDADQSRVQTSFDVGSNCIMFRIQKHSTDIHIEMLDKEHRSSTVIPAS